MSRRMQALAACWVLVNAASITHSAWSFAQLERAGYWWWVGVVAAIGVDAGMASLTWLAMERRRKAGPISWRVGLVIGWPVVGILAAGLVVAFTNYDHAIGVAGTWADLDTRVRVRVVALSLVLPLLTVLMSALVEGEHASAHAPVKVSRPRKAKDETTGAAEPEVSTDAPTTDEGDEQAELPPIRAHNPPPPGEGDKRIAAVLAHMAAHPGATDVSIEGATGVARSTVGRWRRRGLLDPPTAEHSLNGKVGG